MRFCFPGRWVIAVSAVLHCGFAAVSADETKPAALAIAELARDTPVDFEREILPLLKNNCLACHNQTKAKAELILETPATIRKGGDSGPAIVPGKSAESLLLKVTAHREKPFMPPKDNKVNATDFTSGQLALLKLWIDQGARGEVHAAAPIHWLAQPPELEPILAVALTSDGQFAACGRGNDVLIYHIPSGQLAARLAAAGLTNGTHRDLVNTLAFSPDGNQLASGAYREVKLWRRPRDVQKFSLTASNTVTALAVSPDRKWLAASAPDHAIALWDLRRGQIARTLAGHTNTVTTLRFSPDSSRLCSAGESPTLRVWRVADGALAAAMDLPAAVRAVAWMTNGQQLAAGSADGFIRVFEAGQLPRAETPASPDTDASLAATVPGMKLVREFKAHEGAVTALDAWPDGQQLLSGGADGRLIAWNLESGKPVREIKQEGAVIAVAVRPDGRRFASVNAGKSASLWNTADGKLVAELKGDRYANEAVAETERALVVARSDIEFRKKSLETAEADHKKQTERVARAGETNAAAEKVFAEKKKTVDEATATRAAAEKSLADLLAEIKKVTETFASADKTAKEAAGKAKAAGEKATQSRLAAERAALSKADVEKIATEAAAVAAKTKAAAGNDLPEEARAAAQKVAEDAEAVAQKTKSLASAIVANADAKNKMAADARQAADQAIEEIAALAFAAGELKPARDQLLAAAPEKTKQATNEVESAGKKLADVEKEFKKVEARPGITGHELELARQAQQRAADKLAEAQSTQKTAETAQKKIETELEQQKKAALAAEQPVRALAFSPDNLTLATLGDDRRPHTWSAETGAAHEVYDRSAASHSRGPLAFVDASTLIAATDEDRVVAWDTNPAWTLERAIGSGDLDSPLTDRVNAVRFSPDGQTLATGSGESTRSGEIKLWDARDGKFLRELKNVHSDAVLALDFSPDGKHLASSSADRFVRVVELASGKVVKAFEGHTSYVLSVAWKRDGRTLASAGADNVIKVWDFVTGERRKNIEGAGKEVTAIAFVGATDQAVAASGDQQVRLMRENGEKVRGFEGAGDFMNSVAVSPDGGIVVAGGHDGTLRVWNGKNGERLNAFASSPEKPARVPKDSER